MTARRHAPLWLRLLAGLALAYLLIAGGLFLAQRNLIYQPKTGAAVMPASLFGDFAAIAIETPDGERLEAWLHEPDTDQKLMLYLPGNAGDLADREIRFREFADGGYGVLGISWRGYGGSTGLPSEEGLEIDAAAAFAYATETLGIAPDRIVIFGESLGTGLATLLGTRHRVALVLLEAPYTTLGSVAGKRYWWLPVELLLTERFPTIERIPDMEAPLLIIHGAEDTLIPPEQGRRVFAAAPQPKRFVLVPDQGHVLGLDRQLVLREIAKSLGGIGSNRQ